MIDATVSRARLRDLAALGRSHLADRRCATVSKVSASRRCGLADASSIDEPTPPHPRTSSSCPGADDPVASII